MSDLDKRAKEYAKNTEFVEVNYYLKKRYSEKQIKQAYKDGATQETALLSQHILDLQKDKGNLTDKVIELEAENEQIKNSDTLCKLIGEQKRKIAELEEQIEKMQEKLKADLIARLKEDISYSTSPSCTKGMELFIKSIEKWEIIKND